MTPAQTTGGGEGESRSLGNLGVLLTADSVSLGMHFLPLSLWPFGILQSPW